MSLVERLTNSIPLFITFSDNKPGSCPDLIPGTAGICIQACNGDSGCSGDQKCCSNGCGNVCMAPVTVTPSSKPGFCRVPDTDSFGICIQACEDDSACPGFEKCCSNGCGNVCAPPIFDNPGVAEPVSGTVIPDTAPSAAVAAAAASNVRSSRPYKNKKRSNISLIATNFKAFYAINDTFSFFNLSLNYNTTNCLYKLNFVAECYGFWCISVEVHRSKSSPTGGYPRIRKVIRRNGKKITVSY